MKIARFKYKNKIHHGQLKNKSLLLIKGSIFKTFTVTKKSIALEDARMLPPVKPSKIICVGLNYKNHARELNMPIPDEPVIFIKPATAIIGTCQDILYPDYVKRLDYEAELAVIIKKKCKNISVKNAKQYILGYTCLNDVTARDLQKKDNQWTRAKSFDTFCPIGPCISMGIKPDNLKIKLYLNAKLKQNSTTANLIFKVEELISFISSIMTLKASDIISTGTPPGVGPMDINDNVRIEIDKVGSLINTVVSKK